jgi:hypothetical protein
VVCATTDQPITDFPRRALVDLNVAQTVHFGVQVSRSGAGSADLTDSRCLLRAQIGSRGATTPF